MTIAIAVSKITISFSNSMFITNAQIIWSLIIRSNRPILIFTIYLCVFQYQIIGNAENYCATVRELYGLNICNQYQWRTYCYERKIKSEYFVSSSVYCLLFLLMLWRNLTFYAQLAESDFIPPDWPINLIQCKLQYRTLKVIFCYETLRNIGSNHI